MKLEKIVVALAVIGSIVATVDVAGAKGRPDTAPNGDAGSASEYWTSERVAAAQPRDLVIDERGLGYLRRSNGSMSPDGTTVGASATFSVTVTADKSVRSVDTYVGPVGSTKQSFSTSFVGADTWQADLQGFSDGAWEWYVIIREKGRGRVTTTSETVQFTVSTGGGGGGGGGGDITNERWTSGGDVQTAAGRILFTMSDGNFVCSGTAVTDATTGRSIILMAAHRIYDDGGSDGTDSNCTNDPLGCWSVDHGVVDLNWTTRTFPSNIPWDYGYYVVSDTGAHEGSASSDALDTAAALLFDMAKITDLASVDRGFVIDPTIAPTNISLAVDAYKLKGRKTADLAWNGASGSQVDIVRDGVVVAVTNNDGLETDATRLKGGGSTSWQICEAGRTTARSEVVTHTW